MFSLQKVLKDIATKLQSILGRLGVDYIVEQGTTQEGWIYRKWNGGTLDLEYPYEITMADVSSHTSKTQGIALPFAFIDNNFSVFITGGTNGMWGVFSDTYSNGYRNHYLDGNKSRFYVSVQNTYSVGLTFTYNLRVIGRWKALEQVGGGNT